MRTKVERTGWEVIGIACAGMVCIGFNLIAYGFALVKLWEWFVLPTFAGAPALSLPVAIGVDCIATLILPLQPTNPDDKDDTVGEALAKGLGRVVVKVGFVLLLGYIAHRFV